MTIEYVMKAYNNVAPVGWVYWAVLGSPDYSATQSGYNPANLTLPATIEYQINVPINGTGGVAVSGQAGGDLAATYPNPTVAKLQGSSLSPTAPTTVGQSLKWNGSSWIPNIAPLVVNVSLYGAVGNANYQNPSNLKWYVDNLFQTEANDDSAALATAFSVASTASANGQPVIVQLSGNHYVKTPQHTSYGPLSNAAFFLVPSNCTVEGTGSTIRLGPGLNTQDWALFTTTASGSVASSVTNVVFRNLWLDGNGQSGAPVNQRNMFIALLGDNNADIVLENCTFYNQSGWVTVIIGSAEDASVGENIRINNCDWLEIGNSASLTDHVALYIQANNISVTGCNFVNQNPVSRNFGQAIQFQGSTVSITGNTFTNHSNAILVASVLGVNSNNVSITGNTVNSCSMGVAFAQAVGLALTDVTIAGNTFIIQNDQSAQQESAISCEPQNGGDGYGIQRCVIADNIMLFVPDVRYAVTDPCAISLACVTTSFNIYNNIIEGWPLAAIIFEPTAAYNPNAPTGNVYTSDLKVWDLVIKNNSIKNCGQRNNYAIAVICDTTYKLAERIFITDNVIENLAYTTTFGILLDVAGDTVVITNNIVQGATYPYFIESTNGLTNKITSYSDSATVMMFGAKGDGVTDDSAAFQAAVNTLAGTNVSLFVPQGTYKIGTAINVPSNSTILGAKGAVMLGAMTRGGLGNFANSIFIAQGSYIGTQTTLYSAPTLYSFTLLSNATMPVGSNIVVSRGGLESQVFTVRAVTGSVAPFTITVDDPVMLSFQTGDPLQQNNTPSNIIIDGLTFTGTGDRAIELAAVSDSIIRNCTVNASDGYFGSICMSFDIGGRRNLIENVVVDSPGSQGGLALENNSFSIMRNCVVRKINASNAACGLYLPTPLSCILEDCVAIQCNRGAAIQDSDSNDKDGPVDTIVNNLKCYGSTGDYGLLISGGRGCKVSNVVCNNNAADGILVSVGSSQVPDPVQLSNITCKSNGGSGVNVIAPASRVQITNLTTKNNTIAGIIINAANAEVFVNGMLSEDDPVPWSTGSVSNAYLTITNARFRNVSYNGLWTPQPAATGGVVTIENTVYEYVAGTGVKAIVDIDGAATFLFRNIKTIGTLTYGIYAGNSVAANVWILNNVDLQSCTTQITNVGAYLNQSTVAANGTTTVNVAFPDIKATSQVTLTATTAPPTAYVSAITPGTGFAIKSSSGDTQTYNYFIR